MTTNPVLPPQPESLIEQILELSADAQIKRRETLPASLTFHDLTGAIIAYGKVLRLMTKTEPHPGEQYLVIKPLQAAASAGGTF